MKNAYLFLLLSIFCFNFYADEEQKQQDNDIENDLNCKLIEAIEQEWHSHYEDNTENYLNLKKELMTKFKELRNKAEDFRKYSDCSYHSDCIEERICTLRGERVEMGLSNIEMRFEYCSGVKDLKSIEKRIDATDLLINEVYFEHLQDMCIFHYLMSGM